MFGVRTRRGFGFCRFCGLYSDAVAPPYLLRGVRHSTAALREGSGSGCERGCGKFSRRLFGVYKHKPEDEVKDTAREVPARGSSGCAGFGFFGLRGGKLCSARVGLGFVLPRRPSSKVFGLLGAVWKNRTNGGQNMSPVLRSRMCFGKGDSQNKKKET